MVQYGGDIPAQIGVSIAGFAIMTALGWLLDRAKAVPDLFVDVTDFEATKAAIESPTDQHMLSVVRN